MGFDFTIENKLSSEYLLSRISEESIMSFYLGINLKQKGLFRSPLRSDKNPTCSIFRNAKGKLIYKDFATEDYLDCWNVVMKRFNCNFSEALKIVANDFGIIKSSYYPKTKGKIDLNIPKVEEKEFSKIQVEIQDFTELELKWWAKYGITPEILKKFNVFSCKHVFLNGKLISKSQQHCPIFGYYGGKIQEHKEKFELWRCYFPKRTSYRFITNWPSKKIQGYNQLPKKGKLLVITKSMKDVMALSAFNIPAIAPCSENLFISKVVLNNLKERFKHIIVFYDIDIPGIHNMRKIKKEYPELIYLYIPRYLKAKDFSDLRSLYGYKRTKDLIITYIKYLKKCYLEKKRKQNFIK